jgi:hypothetical protein
VIRQGSTDDFIYVKSQRSLGSSFKVKGAGACGSAPQETATKQVEQSDPAPEKPPAKPDPVPDPVPDPLPE